MTINRYYGNTGRVVRMEEPEPVRQSARHAGAPLNRASSGANSTQPKTAPRNKPSQSGAFGGLGNILGGLGGHGGSGGIFGGLGEHGGSGGILDGLGGFMSRAAKHLETEDIILLVMLYLFYRESGDSEWLIIIGAMLFL